MSHRLLNMSMDSPERCIEYCFSRPTNIDLLLTVINKKTFPWRLVGTLGYNLGLEFCHSDNLLRNASPVPYLLCHKYIQKYYLGKPRHTFYTHMRSISMNTHKQPPTSHGTTGTTGDVDASYIGNVVGWCTPILQKAGLINHSETVDIDTGIRMLLETWRTESRGAATYKAFLDAIKATTSAPEDVQYYCDIDSKLQVEIGDGISRRVTKQDLNRMNLEHILGEVTEDLILSLMSEETAEKLKYHGLCRKVYIYNCLQTVFNDLRLRPRLLDKCLRMKGISNDTLHNFHSLGDTAIDKLQYLVDRIECPRTVLRCLKEFNNDVREPLLDYEVLHKWLEDEENILTYQRLLCFLQNTNLDQGKIIMNLITDHAFGVTCDHQENLNELARCGAKAKRVTTETFIDSTFVEQKTKSYKLPRVCQGTSTNSSSLQNTVEFDRSSPLRLHLHVNSIFEGKIISIRLEHDFLQNCTYLQNFDLQILIDVEAFVAQRTSLLRYVIEQLLSRSCFGTDCSYCASASSKYEMVHKILNCETCQKRILIIVFNIDFRHCSDISSDIFRLIERDIFKNCNVILFSENANRKCQFRYFRKYHIVNRTLPDAAKMAFEISKSSYLSFKVILHQFHGLLSIWNIWIWSHVTIQETNEHSRYTQVVKACLHSREYDDGKQFLHDLNVSETLDRQKYIDVLLTCVHGNCSSDVDQQYADVLTQNKPSTTGCTDYIWLIILLSQMLQCSQKHCHEHLVQTIVNFVCPLYPKGEHWLYVLYNEVGDRIKDYLPNHMLQNGGEACRTFRLKNPECGANCYHGQHAFHGDKMNVIARGGEEFQRLFGEHGITEGSQLAHVETHWCQTSACHIIICKFSYQSLYATHCTSIYVNGMLQNASETTTSIDLDCCDLDTKSIETILDLLRNHVHETITKLSLMTRNSSDLYGQILHMIPSLPSLRDVGFGISTKSHVSCLQELLKSGDGSTRLINVTVQVFCFHDTAVKSIEGQNVFKCDKKFKNESIFKLIRNR